MKIIDGWFLLQESIDFEFQMIIKSRCCRFTDQLFPPQLAVAAALVFSGRVHHSDCEGHQRDQHIAQFLLAARI